MAGHNDNAEPYGLDSVVTSDTVELIASQFGEDEVSQDLILEAFEAAQEQCMEDGKTQVDMNTFLEEVNARAPESNGAYFADAITRALDDNISSGVFMKLEEFAPLGVQKYGLDTVIGTDVAGFIAGQFPAEADKGIIMDAFEATKAQCEAAGKPVSFGAFLEEINQRVSDADGARYADTIKAALMQGNDYDFGVSMKLAEFSPLGVQDLDIASLPKFDVAVCATCDVGGLAPVAAQGVAAADKGPQLC